MGCLTFPKQKKGIFVLSMVLLFNIVIQGILRPQIEHILCLNLCELHYSLYNFAYFCYLAFNLIANYLTKSLIMILSLNKNIEQTS